MKSKTLNTAMHSNLARIRAIRARHWGVTRKLIKEVEHLIQQLSDTQGTPEVYGHLETICELIAKKKVLLKGLDEQVFNLCNIDDIVGKIDESCRIGYHIHVAK